jgi:single-strand DNA-binding protein
VIAERAEQFLTKGKLVYLEWHLKTRTLDREDGTKYTKTEVVASELIFLSKREEQEMGAAHAANELVAGFDDFSDLNDTL